MDYPLLAIYFKVITSRFDVNNMDIFQNPFLCETKE